MASSVSRAQRPDGKRRHKSLQKNELLHRRPAELSCNVTPLESAQIIFELLTLAGLVAIAVGSVRKIGHPEGVLLYRAITFTSIVAAFWIIVSMLLQR
jgi:hypothetical protein